MSSQQPVDPSLLPEMSDDVPLLQREESSPANTQGLGQYLQAFRLHQGLSLSAVHDATRYHIKQLQALEEERWHDLPSGFVLRSIVKKFALAVGADPDLAQAKLVAATGEAPKVTPKALRSSLQSTESVDLDDVRKSYATWLWVLGILLTVGLVIAVAIGQGMVDLSWFQRFGASV